METTIFTVDQIDAHGTYLRNLAVDLYTPNPEGITFLELLVQIDAIVGFSRQDGRIMNQGWLFVETDGHMTWRQDELLMAETISIVDVPAEYGPETRVDYCRVGDLWMPIAAELSFEEINAQTALRRPADVENDNFLEWKLEGDWTVTVATAHAPGKVYVTLSPPVGVQLPVDAVSVDTVTDAIAAINMFMVRYEDLLAPMPVKDEDDYTAAEQAALRAGYNLQLV